MSTSPDKPPPVTWATITRVADEAREERFEAPSEEELTRQLREAGFADDAADRLLDRVLAADDAKVAVRPRRWWVPVLAAAALVLLFLLAWKRHEVVAWIEGQPSDIGPDRPGPERTPAERAARMRRDALAACDAEQWDACAAGLDSAKELDPAGETDERVVAARAAMHGVTIVDGGPALKPPR